MLLKSMKESESITNFKNNSINSIYFCKIDME